MILQFFLTCKTFRLLRGHNGKNSHFHTASFFSPSDDPEMFTRIRSVVSASRRRDPLFTQCDNGRTRGNRFKLKEGRFRLGVRRKFHTQRAVRQWHGCPELWVPIPGGAQGHGWGPGQPQLVGGSQPMARGWCCVVFKVSFNETIL